MCKHSWHELLESGRSSFVVNGHFILQMTDNKSFVPVFKK
jgi:hypothetical protein